MPAHAAVDGLGDVGDEQRQVGAAGDGEAGVPHFAAVPVVFAPVAAQLRIDHVQHVLFVVQRLDLGIDLHDAAQRAELFQVGGVGILQVGDGVAVLEFAVFILLAGVEQGHRVADGAVALAVERVAEAVLVRQVGLFFNEFPFHRHGVGHAGVGLVRLDELRHGGRNGSVGHAVVTGEGHKRSGEPPAHFLAVLDVDALAHRLAHHGNAHRQCILFFQLLHLVGKTVVGVEGHLFDGGDAPLVEHLHVFFVLFLHAGQLQILADHLPDHLSVALFRAEAVTLPGRAVHPAGAPVRREHHHGFFRPGVVQQSLVGDFKVIRPPAVAEQRRALRGRLFVFLQCRHALHVGFHIGKIRAQAQQRPAGEEGVHIHEAGRHHPVAQFQHLGGLFHPLIGLGPGPHRRDTVALHRHKSVEGRRTGGREHVLRKQDQTFLTFFHVQNLTFPPW